MTKTTMRRLQIAILLLAICINSHCYSLTSLVKEQQKHSDNNFCQGCRSIISFTQKFNTTNHRQEFKQIFKNYCELYYPVSTDFQQGPCPLVVEALYTVLDHMDPVQHCDQIGACGNPLAATLSVQLSPELKRLPSRQADYVCKFCEQSVEQVQTALSDPATIDQVRSQADQLCEYFKIIEADNECRNLVNKYLDQAVKFIQNIDPLNYCRSIQLCSPVVQQMQIVQQRPLAKKSGASNSRVLNSQQQQQQQQRQLPTLADFNDFGIETSVIIGANTAQQQQQQQQQLSLNNQVKPSPTCTMCKLLVKEMFQFLRDNKTETNIVKGLNEICQVVFPARSEKLDECKSMVGAYTREIIQLLMDETDPEMICVLLEQCLANLPSPKNANSNSDYNNLLANSLPVKSLSPQESGQQPEGAQTLALQSSSGKRTWNLGELIHSLDPTVKLRSAKVCFECKMFIKYLRSTFDEPKSRETIKNWLLNNLCDSIPEKETQTQCARLVQDYADTFFAAIIGSLNPATACADLGACTRKTLNEVLHIDTLATIEQPDQLPSFIVSPIRQHQQQEVEDQGEGEIVEPKVRNLQVANQLCDQCVQIISQIDEYLANHPIDKDVSTLVDQVCNKMPEGSLRNECTFLIETFGSEIAQAVSTMDNPRQLCGKFMLCKVA